MNLESQSAASWCLSFWCDSAGLWNWSDWKGSVIQSEGGSCPRIQSGVVRVDCVMDSGSSSFSRTRSGLVRRKGIFAPNKASCSRTRSGLLRVKSFMRSRDGSCSRTRSGLVRIKSFKDSSDSSCSRTQSDPVRGSPHVVEVCRFLIPRAPIKKDRGMTSKIIIWHSPSVCFGTRI